MATQNNSAQCLEIYSTLFGMVGKNITIEWSILGNQWNNLCGIYNSQINNNKWNIETYKWHTHNYKTLISDQITVFSYQLRGILPSSECAIAICLKQSESGIWVPH